MLASLRPETPASWVVTETATGRVILETFRAEVASRVNTARYTVTPILQHLQSLNRAAREA